MADLSLNYLLTGTDKSASKTMKETATLGQKVAGQVGGAFKGLGNVVGGEIGELLNRVGEGIEKLGEKGLTTGQKLSVMGAGIAGLGVALMALGSGNVQADKQLEASFDAAGAAVEDYADQIDELVAKNIAFGHSDDEVKQALSTLTQALGDPQKALNNMGLVADYAASRHMSLEQAATDLGKALVGSSTRAFSNYGIVIGNTGDRTKDLQDATDQLAQKLGGQAVAASDNFLGRVNALKTGIGNWIGDMASTYGPAVTAFGTALTAVGAIVQIVTAAQAAHAAAQAASSVAEDVGTASTWALNAAWYANPITWIVAAIVLAIAILVAAIVLIWTNWEQISNWIVGIWQNNVMPFFNSVGKWFSDTWNLMTVAAQLAWTMITDAFKNAWNGVVDFFKGIINNGILGPIESAVNWAIDLINNITRGINSVSGLIGIPAIPPLTHIHIARLASGGIVTGSALGTPVIAGDGGKSEIVTNKTQMADFVADALPDSLRTGVLRLHPDDIDAIGRAASRYSLQALRSV